MENTESLIINYLPQSLTDEEFYGLFSTVGPIQHSKIVKNYKTGYSYGFGFVTYQNPEHSLKAIEMLNGFEIGSKRIKVSFARPRSEDIKDTNLYITNLPRNFTENDLDNLFGKFGCIVQKRILNDKKTGLPRGVAFVRFSHRDEAKEAIKHLNGLVLEGEKCPMEIKVAEEHGKMRFAINGGFKAGFQKLHALVHPYIPVRQFNHRNMNPIHSLRPGIIRSFNYCGPTTNFIPPMCSGNTRPLVQYPLLRKPIHLMNSGHIGQQRNDNTPYGWGDCNINNH